MTDLRIDTVPTQNSGFTVPVETGSFFEQFAVPLTMKSDDPKPQPTYDYENTGSITDYGSC